MAVDALMLVASSASPNVAVRLAVVEMAAALATGTVLTTAGGVVSAPTVVENSTSTR